jgi:uncharacterized membrane protein
MVQAQAVRQARLQRITSIVAIVMVLLFAIRLALSLPLSAATLGTDLAGYFSGAQRLQAGLPLYRTTIDLARDPFQYIYPPPLALLLYPLPNYTTAWWVWAGFSIGCWLGALGLICWELRQPLQRIDPAWRSILIAVLINFSPVFLHLIWGQLQLVLLILLTASWMCLRRQRWISAGALLGVAIALKTFPLIVCVPLLAQRRWRVVVVALITAGTVLMLSFALVGWQQAIFYVTTVMPEISRALGDNSAYNNSVSIVLQNILGPSALVAPISLTIRLIVVGSVALCAARLRNDAGRGLALGMTMLVLVPPVVWQHYFVLIYLPWLDELARAARGRVILLALAYFLISTASLVYHMPPELIALAQIMPLCGAFLLLALQLRSAWASAPIAPPTPPVQQAE